MGFCHRKAKTAESYLFANQVMAPQRLVAHKEHLFQVVGVPRSGTTLISTLLNGSSGVVCLVEPYLMWAMERRVAWGEKILHERPEDVLLRALNDGSPHVGFKETWRINRGDGHYFPTENFIKRNYANDLKTIAVIRDPRAIWASSVTRDGRTDKCLAELFFRRCNSFLNWVKSENVFSVRYEDLAQSPETEVSRMGYHLGAQLSYKGDAPAIKGFGDQKGMQGGEVSKVSIERWKDVLDQRDKDMILEGCQNEMRNFGYLY